MGLQEVLVWLMVQAGLQSMSFIRLWIVSSRCTASSNYTSKYCKGFKVSSIESFNRNIFSGNNFLPASVTYQQLVNAESVTAQPLRNEENSAFENSLASPQISLPSNGYVVPYQPSGSAQFTEDNTENHKNQETNSRSDRIFSIIYLIAS